MRDGLRVLIETDTVGGVWTFALDLAASLRDVGHRPHLAALGPGDVRSSSRLAEAKSRGVPASFLPSRLEWEPGVTPADLRRSLDWLRSHDADVAHLCHYAHAAGWSGCPCVLTAHSDVATWWRAVHGEDPPPQYDAYRADLTAALVGVDAVATPTHAYAASLLQLAPEGRGTGFQPVVRPRQAGSLSHAVRGPLGETIIPNGRSLPATRPTVTRAGVLAVGRLWDEGKNVRVLAEAADRAPLDLTLVGPGPAPAGVAHLGELDADAVRQAMTAAVAFANPALYEPFGLAALEAAQCGCALILSDLPTHREVWADAAVFLDPRDPAAWAEALRAVTTDLALAGDLAARAAARAARYAPAATARAYADLYREVAA